MRANLAYLRRPGLDPGPHCLLRKRPHSSHVGKEKWGPGSSPGRRIRYVSDYGVGPKPAAPSADHVGDDALQFGSAQRAGLRHRGVRRMAAVERRPALERVPAIGNVG